MRAIGLRDATDQAIFEAARSANIVIISKDSAFVDMVSRYGPPPQLLWVTCGNVTNRHLMQLFDRSFDEARTLLACGQAMVELNR